MEHLPQIEEGSLEVEVDGRVIPLPGPLRDAWRDDEWLFVMAKLAAGVGLLIYDVASRTERHRVLPPRGWSFDRLTRDVDGGPSMIAWTPDAINGHNDWHFAIDPTAGTLLRTHPSR